MLGQDTTTTTTPASEPVFVAEEVVQGCDEGGFLCEQVYDWTGSETAADVTAFFVGAPLSIVIIIVVAAVINRLLRRSIRHLGERIGRSPEGRATDLLVPGRASERARQRAETLSAVLKSVATLFVWTIAVILVLGELGINLAPLIAGAGIAGVALGFGAQSLVKDFLTGFFMLLEDQYGVGDIVDVGEAEGVVEKVTLRITTLRSLDGTLWHVPNGEIVRVGNKSQLWSRALLDIGIAYGADIDRATEVIKATADELWRDPVFAGAVKEEPEVLGVERLDPDSVTIRLTVKTEPAAQWRVERALRARIKQALDDAAIEIPFPQRTVWIRRDELPPDAAESPDPGPPGPEREPAPT